MTVTFTVHGTPAPKGSKSLSVRGGRPHMYESSKKERPWAQQVYWTAREFAPPQPWSGAIELDVTFFIHRPQRLGKTRTGVLAVTGFDTDKGARSCGDALTGLFYFDDKQVSDLHARKRYADFGQPTGAEITVTRLEAA